MTFNDTNHDVEVRIENRGQSSCNINLPKFDGAAIGLELLILAVWMIPASLSFGLCVRLFMWTAGFAE